MPDFYQHARLPTLHHLAVTNTGEREAEIESWTACEPVALLLPALFAEFERPVLPKILSTVSRVPYVGQVIISVNGMNAEGLKKATALCRKNLADKPFSILWNDGPEASRLKQKMDDLGMPPFSPGKGSNVWLALLSLIAGDHSGIVVGHDTDISSYGRELLVKLSYPLVHPSMPYRFAKGYYGRVSGRLYGRVTRLMIFPLIQSFIEVMGTTPLLQHLESFRYPLAGEFAASMDALGRFSIPAGWGLEIAMLCDAHRHLKPEEICQVDIGSNFEHRHRRMDEEPEDARPDAGLLAAASEVATCLFTEILRDVDPLEGMAILAKVGERYKAKADEWVGRYEHVALLNGLEFHRSQEQYTVDLFASAITAITRDGASLRSRVQPMLPPAAGLLAEHPSLVPTIHALSHS